MTDDNSPTPDIPSGEVTEPEAAPMETAMTGMESEVPNVQSPDDTAETAQIQVEQVPLPPPPPTKPLVKNIRRERITALEQLLIEKEQLILGYTNKQIPKPYYERWKRDANEVFQLLVRTSKRGWIERLK